MNNNAIQLLSNLIYQVYNVEDFDEMRLAFLQCLQRLSPSKCVTLLMAVDAESGSSLCEPMAWPPE